jgi:hypothetical protein
MMAGERGEDLGVLGFRAVAGVPLSSLPPFLLLLLCDRLLLLRLLLLLLLPALPTVPLPSW